MSKILKEIKSMASDIKDVIDQEMISPVHTCRDENANLVIVFSDGEEVRLPYVPLRIYQLELQYKLFIEKILRAFLNVRVGQVKN